jgi:hypothetical protein
MATVAKPNATRRRTTKLVNPARRNWSAKQIRAGFAGKRRQAALKAHPKKTYPPRPNITGIAVAGLPAAINPHHRKTAPEKKEQHTMQKAKSNAPGRSNAKTNRGHRASAAKTHTNKFHGHHHKKPNPMTKTVTKWRANAKKNRKNPLGESASQLLQFSLWGAGGAVGSRLIPNWILGTANTSWMGYISNIGTGFVLAWAARKWVSPLGASAILAGTGIALVLRLIQDFAPGMIGSYVQAGGLGDPGMGALLPSSFVDPAIFTGNGAQVRIPPAWQQAPPPAAAPAATVATSGKSMSGIPSTYSLSTYGR